MFDVGFSEIVVIGVIALVVFGPEDLPRVARTAGHVLGKLRRYVADAKEEINREMELADLKRVQAEMQDSLQSIQSAVSEQARSLETEFHETVQTFHEEVVAPVAEIAAPTLEPAAPVANDGGVPQLAAQATEEGTEAVEDPNQLDLFAQVPASDHEKKAS